MKRALFGLTVLACVAGCNKDNPTTPTTTNTTISTQIFLGTLAPGASSFYSFTVNQDNTKVQITLASLVKTGAGDALANTMNLGLGTPAGLDCGTAATGTTSPSFVAQLATTMAKGTRCVRIADPGTLASSADFVVRIVQVPEGASLPTGTTTTTTLASTLLAKQSMTRTFTVSGTGTIDVTLTTITPSSTTVGIGIGIALGGTCYLTRTQSAGTGSRISMGVDPGTYCVKLYDIGSFVGPTAISVDVSHP